MVVVEAAFGFDASLTVVFAGVLAARHHQGTARVDAWRVRRCTDGRGGLAQRWKQHPATGWVVLSCPLGAVQMMVPTAIDLRYRYGNCALGVGAAVTSGARRAVSVEERLQVAFGGVDRDGQPFIFRPLEVIEPRPMKWQLDGLEDMQFDRRVRRRED